MASIHHALSDRGVDQFLGPVSHAVRYSEQVPDLDCRCSWCLLLHDLFNALLDLLRSLFGMPTPVNPAGHAGNDCAEIFNEIMLGVAWKQHFQGTSLHG